MGITSITISSSWFLHSALKKIAINKELLDKCERDNEIAPLWLKC